MTTPQPPHLISALEQLDDEFENGTTPPLEDEPETPARRQPGQLIEVMVEGEEPYNVRVANRELIHYEKLAARHKEWPEQGRNFVMTFCTWSAARRAGRTSVTFEKWQEVLEDWNPVKDVPADPTR